jgi:hypothetical protein
MPSLSYVTSDRALARTWDVTNIQTGGAVGSRENKKRPAVGGPRSTGTGFGGLALRKTGDFVPSSFLQKGFSSDQELLSEH